MRLRVEVTKEDIRRGVRDDVYYCPVARALRRAGLRETGVMEPGIYAGGVWLGRLPRRVARFVDRFDKIGKRAVKPFVFILNGVPPFSVER